MVATSEVVAGNGNGAGEHTALVRAKLIHSLEIYPFQNRSMLHINIGSSLPTSIWKPVLDEMVKEGEIIARDLIAKSPTARNQVYEIFHLPYNRYEYGPNETGE